MSRCPSPSKSATVRPRGEKPGNHWEFDCRKPRRRSPQKIRLPMSRTTDTGSAYVPANRSTWPSPSRSAALIPSTPARFNREDLACHIYWGSAEGFHTRRRSTLFCDSVNDSLAGDFNGDGLIDLAVACHTRHGNHRAFSRVFYNDGHRFRRPRMTRLPTNGTHLMWALDIGNVMDRSYRETFESRVWEWSETVRRGQMRVRADVPRGGGLSMTVRSAANAERLQGQAWRTVRGRKFALLPGDRVLQYRATFTSDNGDRYPVLDRVEIRIKD